MSTVDVSRRFEGASVLVTGGGRGIGRAICHQYAREGARVVVLDRDRETCELVVKEIADAGGSAVALVIDLGDPAARSRAIEEAVAAGGNRLDVLVNNAAALGPRRPLLELSDADVQSVIDVSLIAPMLLSRDAAPHLARTGGAIIMLGSIQATMPLPTFVPYVSCKGAIDAMTRALAVELAGSGVRVNAVAPGAVESPAMQEQWRQSGNAARPPAPTLVGRWGTDRDIAEVVVFLSSRAAEYISGETIRVDGGRLLNRGAEPLTFKP